MDLKRFSMIVASAALFTAINAGTVYASDLKVPLPGSLLLVITGAAGLAAGGWWIRRK